VAIADPENHFTKKYQWASSDAIGTEYADIVGLLGAGGSDKNGKLESERQLLQLEQHLAKGPSCTQRKYQQVLADFKLVFASTSSRSLRYSINLAQSASWPCQAPLERVLIRCSGPTHPAQRKCMQPHRPVETSD
jgi:hypothetical protein